MNRVGASGGRSHPPHHRWTPPVSGTQTIYPQGVCKDTPDRFRPQQQDDLEPNTINPNRVRDLKPESRERPSERSRSATRCKTETADQPSTRPRLHRSAPRPSPHLSPDSTEHPEQPRFLDARARSLDMTSTTTHRANLSGDSRNVRNLERTPRTTRIRSARPEQTRSAASRRSPRDSQQGTGTHIPPAAPRCTPRPRVCPRWDSPRSPPNGPQHPTGRANPRGDGPNRGRGAAIATKSGAGQRAGDRLRVRSRISN